MLAVAGYDMQLTLYDVTRLNDPLGRPMLDAVCPVLQVIKYTSKIGPAFIWSTEFSKDGEAIILGCWSGAAFVYTIDFERARQVAERGFEDAQRAAPKEAEGGDTPAAEPAPAPDGGPEVLTEAALVQRGDRVYAVDCNVDAGRLVVGGRDKKVAMFDTEKHVLDARTGAPSKEAPPLMWEVTAEDFVYSCSLTADFQYCAYGGTSRAVAVLDAASGRSLYDIACPGTVWTVALLGGAGAGPCKIAIGGEHEKLAVYDVESCKLELQLPVDEVIYEIALSPDALCFSHAKRCSLYGNGGAQYSWQDMPAFDVVRGLIKEMLSKPDELIKTMTLILDRHPAVVNARDPRNGSSLLHFVTEHCNVTQVLELLLQADCRIGLQQNYVGMTALHAALYHSKWGALRQLYGALLADRFTFTPGAMALVAECFAPMAARYPKEFLQFVSRMPLQGAPELLGGEDTHSVMIPHMLVCGSDQRCPRDVWRPALQKYTRKEDTVEQDMAELLDKASKAAAEVPRPQPARLLRP